MLVCLRLFFVTFYSNRIAVTLKKMIKYNNTICILKHLFLKKKLKIKFWINAIKLSAKCKTNSLNFRYILEQVRKGKDKTEYFSWNHTSI